MSLTVKSPNPGDSNSVLTWKYAVNLYVAAATAGATDLMPPKLGSTENALLLNALKSAQALG